MLSCCCAPWIELLPLPQSTCVTTHVFRWRSQNASQRATEREHRTIASTRTIYVGFAVTPSRFSRVRVMRYNSFFWLKAPYTKKESSATLACDEPRLVPGALLLDGGLAFALDCSAHICELRPLSITSMLKKNPSILRITRVGLFLSMLCVGELFHMLAKKWEHYLSMFHFDSPSSAVRKAKSDLHTSINKPSALGVHTWARHIRIWILPFINFESVAGIYKYVRKIEHVLILVLLRHHMSYSWGAARSP